MNATELKDEVNWYDICDSADLLPNLGVRALINGQQIAVFKVQQRLFAINSVDPFSHAAVLSRGIVGDLKGQLVVASPIYKQHFNLETGICLEDESVSVAVYPIREDGGRIWVAV